MHNKISKDLKAFAKSEKALILQRFFKTGKGQYGEGDKFIGVVVPDIRTVAKKWLEVDYVSLEKLLHSKIHEERMVALLILVLKFKKGDVKEQKKIYSFYLKNYSYINNWDLVDLTAPNIVGEYLYKNPNERKILYRLAVSKNLWQKRIAIIATFTFLRQKDFTDTLNISKILLTDKHDLIHKAVGWMLREVGKRDICVEEKFLKEYYKQMPRTMLRYAIEKFPEVKRKKYLAGLI